MLVEMFEHDNDNEGVALSLVMKATFENLR